jgi:hypothetical protein
MNNDFPTDGPDSVAEVEKRPSEVAARCDCSALRLIDWKAVDNKSHRNAGIQQLPRFEVRRGEEVLSQGATEVEAWQRCAEFLAPNKD